MHLNASKTKAITKRLKKLQCLRKKAEGTRLDGNIALVQAPQAVDHHLLISTQWH